MNLHRNFSDENSTLVMEKPNLIFWQDILLTVFISMAWGFAYLSIQTCYFYLPPSYEGDGLWYGMIAKNLAEGNSWAETSRLGAPFGQALWDFPYFYWVHILTLKVLVLITNNIFTALQIFVLISYGVAAFAAYPAFRLIGLQRILAIAGSVIFVGLPYHFHRQGGHMFLAAYFCIPLIFIATYATALPDDQVKKKWLIIIGILCGGCGIYYAVLMGWCILFGLIAEARDGTKLKNRFLNSAICLGSLTLSTLFNLIPHIIFWIEQGINHSAVVRLPSEVNIYGLLPINLLLPQPKHLLSIFADLTDHYARDAYFVNENMTASLGVLSGTGFLLSIAILLVPRLKTFNPEQIKWLTRFNLWVILFAIVGGIGTVIAYFIGPYIRALNRFSIMIGFISLSILALAAQYQFNKRAFSFKKITGVMLLCFALAVVDQTPSADSISINKSLNKFSSDRKFTTSLEAVLLGDSPLLTLPHIEFPEGNQQYLESSYDPLRLYLHSNKLKQSYGTTKGRLADLWLKKLNELPPAELAIKASSSGFQGVILFRQTPPSQQSSLEAELQQTLGNPTIESDLKDIAFYKLQPSGNSLAPLILNPTLGDGWYIWESNEKDRWVWSKGDAELRIGHTFAQSTALILSFNLYSLHPRSVTIFIGNNPNSRESFNVNATKRKICIRVEMAPGIHNLYLKTDKPPASPKSKDKRLLAFSVENPVLKKISPEDLSSCQENIQMAALNN